MYCQHDADFLLAGAKHCPSKFSIQHCVYTIQYTTSIDQFIQYMIFISLSPLPIGAWRN